MTLTVYTILIAVSAKSATSVTAIISRVIYCIYRCIITSFADNTTDPAPNSRPQRCSWPGNESSDISSRYSSRPCSCSFACAISPATIVNPVTAIITTTTRNMIEHR
ncbi:hypothetical protein Q5A_004670 [Serratia inhibens PRI-2C]|nr:hypothetical protein Q5A_004670 [Serratia inhibens PRI-2C]